MKKLLLFLFILSLPAFSQQLSKAYILSEGGFSSGTSKLSMLDVVNNNFSDNIFNPGQIGLYPDGIILYDDHLYLLEQGSFGGSGKIYKTDTTGLVLSSEVVGTNPYSLAMTNNKIYITNGPAGNVSVLNLNDLSFIKNIAVGVYPQEIISLNDKIFVANNSLFGGAADSTVSVIDPVLDTVISTIVVKKDPSSLSVSNDGFLFIGCPGDGDNGKIFKADPSTFQLIDTISLPGFGFGKDLVQDKAGNNLFFISSINDIVKYNLDNEDISGIIASVFPNNYYYGYNYDYVNKNHYVLDAKDFTITGTFTIHDSAGTIIDTYSTGIAPKKVLLKYNEPSTGVEENFHAANSFTLEQNYPNPFNPSTKIRWTLPQAGYVTLKVYDVLGSEIASLMEEERASGIYETDFDGSGLGSGIYFYKLEAGSFVQIKKMTLIK